MSSLGSSISTGSRSILGRRQSLHSGDCLEDERDDEDGLSLDMG